MRGGARVTIQTLEYILRLCHPASISNPPILELDVIKGVLGAARKYGMDGAEIFIRNALISPRFPGKEPMRVFAIACLFKATREARIAAAATLEFDIAEELGYINELEDISGADLFHIQDYHKHCKKLAREYIDTVIDSCESIIMSGGTNIRSEEGVEWRRKFYTRYLKPHKEALDQGPVGRAARAARAKESVDKALQSAPACTSCNQHVGAFELESSVTSIGEEIDGIISKVKLSQWELRVPVE
ncbi:hypothetical protein FIBSPDRAFT_934698 [Athelia psychrophila]|uniref:Uncharacterized protein n=1 Tax=Athelia psychrophila TaxID=1759441 RepID=A0A166F372_9AGAM|nr:hypothetical protein FIBSPDRAFT_934698 [Fibularhizoctonia sp. CBS 109695]